MFAALLTLSLPAVLLNATDVTPGTQFSFRGSLAPSDAEQRPDARKQFDLTCWVKSSDAAGTELYWLLDERARGEWPWIERFGAVRMSADGHTTGDAPALLYDRPDAKTADSKSIVPLPTPWLAVSAAKPLAAGAEWQVDRLQYRVEKADQRAQRSVWQLALRDPFGPRGTWWRDQNSQLVVALVQPVVLGRGEEHTLRLDLQSSEQLDAPAMAALGKAFDALLALRGKLGQARHRTEIEWDFEELALFESALPEVEKAATGTPLARLTTAARRDLKLQAGRSEAVADLEAEFVSKAVGPFSARGLGNETLTDANLKGHVTLLHFWDYRDEPLKEPYGQVGYLDYLYQRRKAGGLRVYGVAVDGRLADEKTRPAAERSVRKLKEFMNLSFPVLLDQGGLLKQFGDPRVLGANLPLFVVVGPDGRIAHYHVGTYEVHQDQGLKDLDDAVVAELGKQK